MNNLTVRAFLNALGTLAYVSLVALIMYNGEKIFGREDTFLIPVAILSLFVLSAAVTGALILGKPILLYWDGRKAEAVKLFFYTLGWMCLLMVGLFVKVFLK